MAQQEIHRKLNTLRVHKGHHHQDVVVVKKRKRKRLLSGSIVKKIGVNSSQRMQRHRRSLKGLQFEKENFQLVALVKSNQEEKKKIVISNPASPLEQVLRDTSQLKQILRHFNSRTLLNLRLVCSKWNNVATRILTHRKSFNIIFDVSSSSSSSSSDEEDEEGTSRRKSNIIVLNGNKRKFRHKTLDMLSTCLSGSKNGIFPCAKFIICTEILAKLELQGFLYLHGRFIKNLELRSRSPLTASASSSLPSTSSSSSSSSNNKPIEIGATLLGKLLVEQATNVVSLKLCDISWDPTQVTLFSNNSRIKTFLPLLRHVSINQSTSSTEEQNQQQSKIVGQLLGAALNLQTITVKSNSTTPTPLLFLDMLVKGKAIHAVKTLHFCPNQDNIDLYEKFAEAQPRLKSITISKPEEEGEGELELEPRMGNVLSKILESSKDTMEVCQLRDEIDNFLQFPLLKAVKTMELVNFSSFCDHWTNGQYWTHTFPNLTTLRITGSGSEQLPFAGIADSVQTLGISDDLSLDFIDKLVTSCPFVIKVTVGLTLDFPRFGHALWNFELLKVLDLNVEHSTANCFPKLDAALTGFTVAECKFLNNFCHKIRNYHCFTRRPSIIDLKHLRQLKLHFIATSNFIPKNNYFSVRQIPLEKFLFLSPVTGMYAFRKMPQLNVNIFVQISMKELSLYGKALQVISPFAEVHINVVHDGLSQKNKV